MYYFRIRFSEITCFVRILNGPRTSLSKTIILKITEGWEGELDGEDKENFDGAGVDGIDFCG